MRQSILVAHHLDPGGGVGPKADTLVEELRQEPFGNRRRQLTYYSGRTPCVGSSGHAEEGAEEDGEQVRWRSSAFVAVSGRVGATFQAAFKASTGTVDGIYLARGPGQGQAVETVLDTTMDGQELDPEAPEGSTISELGLEREGLRGNWLVVSAKMGIEGGEEEDDMAGVYLTRVNPK